MKTWIVSTFLTMLRKPFEGGNYPMEKIICGNTVFTLVKLKPTLRPFCWAFNQNIWQTVLHIAVQSLYRIVVQILWQKCTKKRLSEKYQPVTSRYSVLQSNEWMCLEYFITSFLWGCTMQSVLMYEQIDWSQGCSKSEKLGLLYTYNLSANKVLCSIY